MQNKSFSDTQGSQHYGESGLTDDILNPDYSGIQINDATNESIEIARALTDFGFDAQLQENELFKTYYKQVVTGPGRDWNTYKRARFTLQTMNRAGCIEWPIQFRPTIPQKSPVAPTDNDATARLAQETDKMLDIELSKPRFTKPYIDPQSLPELYDDYRILSKSEIRNNLIVVAAILLLIIITVLGMFLAVKYQQPAIGATAGGASLAVAMAVASRLARHWHNRFSKTYILVRMLVCLGILYTKVPWATTASAYSQFYDVFGDIVSGRVFGLCLCIVLIAMTIISHVKLCRTFNPSKGKTLGWVEALCMTFAIGALLFSFAGK